MLYFPL